MPQVFHEKTLSPDPGQVRARKERYAAALYEKRLRETRKVQSAFGGGLLEFIRYFWHVLEPAREFSDAWPIHALCEHLEAITRGEITGEREITRFLANVPPGFMKSLTVNVFWPAWEWGPMELPHLRYIAFSYAAHLTERDNAKFRDLITSRPYQELWGHVFKVTSDGKIKVGNDHQGFKFASSIGGVGTGERADRVLCLPESERVLTDRGWLPIGDIVKGRLQVKIAGWNHSASEVVWQDIEAYESNPGSEIVEVACEAGSVKCTGDHPVHIEGHGYARADSLASGDAVVWAGRRFPLPELQKGDSAQAEPPSKILQHRVQNAGQSKSCPSSEQSPMPDMRKAGVSPLAARAASEAWHFLRAKLLSAIQQRRKQPDVYGRHAYKLPTLLEEIHSSAPAHSLLQQTVRSVCAPHAHGRGMGGASLLSGVCDGVRGFYQNSKILLSPLCGQGAFIADERGGEREVCARAGSAAISSGLDAPAQGTYSQEGWQPLLSMRPRAGGWTPSGCSPHRLHEGEPKAPKFDNALPLVPWPHARQLGAAQELDVVSIVSVTRVGKAGATYNLRVGPCHNYFAEGFLVHNCDDPHHVHQAESETIRKSTVRWFRESMSNRLNSMRDSVIVVIMQRVHEEDVSGAVIEDGGYCHLMIPFDYDSSRHCTTQIGWSDPRTEDGQTPWDDRFGPDEMAPFRRQTYLWAGQYQQLPAPRGGGILKDNWWQLYEVPETGSYDFEPLFIVGSLDTAFKEKQENDYSALTVWAVYDDATTGLRRIMLVDGWKKRLPLHGVRVPRKSGEEEMAYMRRAMPQWGLVEWVNFTCSRRKVHRLLIEDSARGHDVGAEIRRLYADRSWGVKLVPARGDKQARAHAIVDLFTDDMIYAPGQWVCSQHQKPRCRECPKDQLVWRWRDWVEPIITDCSVFPKGTHDDIVDSVTMALKHLREVGFAVRRDEKALADDELARSRPDTKGGVWGSYAS